jgi:hypothetical protein
VRNPTQKERHSASWEANIEISIPQEPTSDPYREPDEANPCVAFLVDILFYLLVHMTADSETIYFYCHEKWMSPYQEL